MLQKLGKQSLEFQGTEQEIRRGEGSRGRGAGGVGVAVAREKPWQEVSGCLMLT